MELMSIFLGFLCLLPIFIVSLFTFPKKLQSSKWKFPPSPCSLPIIGNLHQLRDSPNRTVHNLSIKHGPVMRLLLGTTEAVVISSSEAAEEMLRTHDLDISTRSKMVGPGKLSYGFQDITFRQYGEYWRELRKVAVIELFSLKRVQYFRCVREEEVGLVVKKLSEAASTQTPVDLSKTIFSLTASIICRVALGQNFHECEYIDQEKIEELVTDAANTLGNFTYSDLFQGGFGRSLDWLFGKHKKMNEVFKEFDDFYQHVIDDHLKETSGRKNVDSPTDIVAVMLDIIKKQGNEDYFKLNNDNIKGVLMDIFLAGVDTSAITMIWAMTELARSPRVMKKVQEEIRTTLGTGKKTITEDELKKVEYLQLIIKETFRLHPPVPLIGRETTSHIKIQGYDIPAKTSVYINVWTIGRDPKCWTDPEDFIPERFINSSIDFRGQNYNLLPFGAGRRMCPAISMSITGIELALLNMLYFFDWRLPDGIKAEDIDVEGVGALSVVKTLPLMLVPVQRE